MVKDIHIDDFDYDLPEEKIATHPLQQRDSCKLLLSSPSGKIYHRSFKELASLLPPGSLLICNETKVIKARLEFHKDTGARIEIFLLEPVQPADYAMMFQSKGHCRWKCLVGNLKKWKGGVLELNLPDDIAGTHAKLFARKEDTENNDSEIIDFTWTPANIEFARILEQAGNIPIPPYLNREAEDTDETDYQTVYARSEGSVAAPTAGLHFTPGIFEDLQAHNVKTCKLALHVGAGTFKPVKADVIGDHPMHTETFTVSCELIDNLIRQKEKGDPVVAVGTTTVRTLESLPILGYNLSRGDETLHVGQWQAYDKGNHTDTISLLRILSKYMEKKNLASVTASTAIMIAPGFPWRVTDCMITNFHQPKSTLLLLVSSFLEDSIQKDNTVIKPRWRKIYEEALQKGYRFLSYGDASLFVKNAGNLNTGN